MKKTVFLIMVGLSLCFSVPLAAQGTSGTARPAPIIIPEEGEADYVPSPPLFVLETLPDDAPPLAQKKAALRLFKNYSVTVGILSGCRAKGQEAAGAALGGFNNRNGSTLGQTMAVIKRLGGFTSEIKTTLDTTINAEVMMGGGDCQYFTQEVQSGGRDLYKAPQYADDYAVMRGRTPAPETPAAE